MKSIISRLAVVSTTSLTVISFLVIGVGAHAANQANKACYEQFNVAKKAGNLKEKNFKAFKAANCKNEVPAKPEVASTTAAPIASEHAKDTTTIGAKTEVKKEDKAVKTAKEPDLTNVVFPNEVNPKYAQEKAGTARQKTCLDQYNANKATGKNGELKWIQKGGGYYSYCTKHLKK